jgi:flagellar hook assembly protein FlgD
VSQGVPDEFTLQQNYPNPFNPSTTIRYSTTTPGNISIIIYDITGELIKEITREHNQAGEYEIIWNGKNNFGERVSSGAYFYQIVAGDYVEAKKMILLK